MATTTATVPKACIFPAALESVANKLAQHGIAVTRLDSSANFPAEVFTVSSMTTRDVAQNGHLNTLLRGSFRAASMHFQVGDYFVSMEQRLANLLFYLLEAESDDGLAHWNYFDDYLTGQLSANSTAVEFPVFKVLQ